MSGPTIAAGFAKAFLDFAVSRGVDRETLLARSLINRGDLADAENRIALANYLKFIEVAIDLSAEPAFALHFGEAVRLRDISILGFVGDAGTAEQSREQANRFGRLVLDEGVATPTQQFEFVREADNVWVNFAGQLYRQHRHLIETTLAQCVCDGRAFAASYGEQGWPCPKAIRFSHPEPAYRAEYDRIFAMPVEFSSSMNGIMFGEELLSARMAPQNVYVERLANQEAEALLKRLDSSTTVRGRVEQILMPVLQRGEATIELAANTLGVSRQTLFRRLKAEGVTFQQVLDELRCRQALRYLNEEKLSINKTAYLVGFSNAAAFSRAFKRWTGTSPRDS